MSPFRAATDRFVHEGNLILRQTRAESSSTSERRFRSFFGTSPVFCGKLWELVAPQAPPLSQPKHLLWALLFLKIYASEHVNRTLTGVDEKTFRKWAWLFVRLLASLSLIRFVDRHKGREDKLYRASVDGVDFMIQEPAPFNPMWYSHKFKGPGLRYEIAVGIGTGNICWALGPFPCGRYTDLTIYRLRLKGHLEANERVIADAGYKDDTTSFSTVEFGTTSHSYVRARHEAFNKRMKQFNLLGRRFRHALNKHADCFFAVANVTYLLIEEGESIFL